MPVPELLTRAAIWLATLLWTISLMAEAAERWKRARWAWVAGFLAYAVHAALAFVWFYGGSHAVAWRETARRTEELTGIATGAGLLVNELLLVVWGLDALAWLCRGVDHRARTPRGWRIGLHAGFLFLFVQGGIVFAHGPVRWFTGGCLLVLGLAWRRRRARFSRSRAAPRR